MNKKRHAQKKHKSSKKKAGAVNGQKAARDPAPQQPLLRDPNSSFGKLPLQSAQQQAVLAQIGQMQGNRYVQRLVDYNHEPGADAAVDPERTTGTLPFNEDGGWEGVEIVNNLTQLSRGVDPDDNLRCVETSFLAGMILRGPGALQAMIENYLSRYRVGLRQLTTPDRIKRWYRRSLGNLAPLIDKIEGGILTYEDLSTILAEMYDVYGNPQGGTFLAPELNMAGREGYETTELNIENASQEETAAEAQGLEDGEMLLLAIHAAASGGGVGDVNHRIHIGRDPNSGNLYLFDPWPVSGDQLTEVDNNLSQIEHYFWDPMEADEEDAEDLDIEILELRTVNIDAKISPPAEDMEE